MSSAPTPWSLLNVEGDDDISDDEDNATGNALDNDAASSILSPASKRAKKRQAAARNKRAKEEAKQQVITSSSLPATAANKIAHGVNAAVEQAKASTTSNGASSTLSKANGASSSSSKALPNPPTFVDQAADSNGRLASASASSASTSNVKLGDPFLRPSGGASSSKQQQQAQNLQPPTLTSYASSSAATETEEEEDMSLLIDEDDESSSSASSSGAEEGDESLLNNQAVTGVTESSITNLVDDPATPRLASTAQKFASSASDTLNSVKKSANSALDNVAQNGSLPSGVQSLAAKARDSNSLKVSAEDVTTAVTGSDQPYGSDHDPSKKWKSVVTRTIWTLVMIAGFAALMTMGHVYLIILVMFCQAAVFKEISALFDVAAKPVHTHHHHHHSRNGSTAEKAISPTRAARDARAKAERERWSKVTSWYFFAATNYFLHGETIIYYFKHIVFVDAYFIPFARHHRFISFMLYVLGFVGFVTNLKRNQLRRQFGLFCWIHMSLLLIVVSSHFIVNNILEGIIWFWLPASLVVMNDIAAYVWGMLFGRTQLIKLSPKKTVEGFVGAAFTTVVFAYVWATIFMRYSYMICPATDLGTTAFSSVACEPNDVFNWRYFNLPQEISNLISSTGYSIEQIPWAPFQFHAIIMGIFASLVAPFGGFFASGFKRAFNVKDFGDSIPGHGGMTDRMDCQFLMGLFAYVYYSSIIRDNHVTVGAVMQTIVSSLSQQEQAELAKALAGYLAQQGIKWQ